MTEQQYLQEELVDVKLRLDRIKGIQGLADSENILIHEMVRIEKRLHELEGKEKPTMTERERL